MVKASTGLQRLRAVIKGSVQRRKSNRQVIEDPTHSDDLQEHMPQWRHSVAKAQAKITLSATVTMALVVRKMQQERRQVNSDENHWRLANEKLAWENMRNKQEQARQGADIKITDQTGSDNDIDTRKVGGAQHDAESEQKGCNADNAGTPLRAEKLPVHACDAGERDQAIQGAGKEEITTAHRAQPAWTRHAAGKTSASNGRARTNDGTTAGEEDGAHVVADCSSVGHSTTAGDDDGTHLVAISSMQAAR